MITLNEDPEYLYYTGMIFTVEWYREESGRMKAKDYYEAKFIMKGTLNRKLEDPKFRKSFDNHYELFQLEVQMLNALEDKGWTYEDLANAVGTSKQNIWRDLKNGGLHKASMDRVAKIAEVLGLRMHSFLISQKKEKSFLPKLQRILAAA